MASTKITIFVAIICFLLQCVDSRSIVNDLSKNMYYWKLDGLKDRLSVDGPAKKIVLPNFARKFGISKLTIPKPKFGKPGKLNFLNLGNGKLSKISNPKSALLKKNLAYISKLKSLSKGVGGLSYNPNLTRKFGNKLRINKLGKSGKGKFSKLGLKSKNIRGKLVNIFGRRLMSPPMLSLNRNLGHKGLSIRSGLKQLASKGLYKKSLRQRLADKLGLANRFQFFDRTSNIFNLNKKVNALDMFDGKLAELDARFGNRINNRYNKKIGRLNLFPDEATLLKGKLALANYGKMALIAADLDGKVSDALANAGISGKVEGIVVSKKANRRRKLPLLNGVGSKKRSLLGGLRLSSGFSRLGGGLKLRSGLNRFGRGMRLGGGLRFGHSKLSLIRPRYGLRRRFSRIGVPKIDSRSIAAIANVVVAAVNGQRAPASNDAYNGNPRRLRSPPRETLLQRLSKKSSLRSKLSVAKEKTFSNKLAEKVNLRLGSNLRSKHSSIFAGKFGKMGKYNGQQRKFPKLGRKIGKKFGNLFSRKSKFQKLSDVDVISSTSTPSTASAGSEIVSRTVSDAIAAVEGGLSGMGNDAFSRIPGRESIIFAINLLENGGTVEETVNALLERNDKPALKTLMDAVKQAALNRISENRF